MPRSAQMIKSSRSGSWTIHHASGVSQMSRRPREPWRSMAHSSNARPFASASGGTAVGTSGISNSLSVSLPSGCLVIQRSVARCSSILSENTEADLNACHSASSSSSEPSAMPVSRRVTTQSGRPSGHPPDTANGRTSAEGFGIRQSLTRVGHLGAVGIARAHAAVSARANRKCRMARVARAHSDSVDSMISCRGWPWS
jgi:hypothetical protein